MLRLHFMMIIICNSRSRLFVSNVSMMIVVLDFRSSQFYNGISIESIRIILV